MKTTHQVLQQNESLIEDYRVDAGEVGVLFSPQSYYLHWAQEETSKRCIQSMQGYLRALVRHSISYRVIEEEHLNDLGAIKILFLPRTLVVSDVLAERLTAFVQNGGTLVCESECGAFDPVGIYRYPEQRFTAKMSGIKEIGRRSIEDTQISVILNGKTYTMEVTQWLTPWETHKGKVLCAGSGGSLVSEVSVGKGRVILFGSYAGETYFNRWQPGFEEFIKELCYSAGCSPQVSAEGCMVTDTSFIYLKAGESQGKKMVFVFFPKDQDQFTLRLADGFLHGTRLQNLITGEIVAIRDHQCVLTASAERLAVLVELTE